MPNRYELPKQDYTRLDAALRRRQRRDVRPAAERFAAYCDLHEMLVGLRESAGRSRSRSSKRRRVAQKAADRQAAMRSLPKAAWYREWLRERD